MGVKWFLKGFFIFCAQLVSWLAGWLVKIGIFKLTVDQKNHFKVANQSVMPLLEQEFLKILRSYPSPTWIPFCILGRAYSLTKRVIFFNMLKTSNQNAILPTAAAVCCSIVYSLSLVSSGYVNI